MSRTRRLSVLVVATLSLLLGACSSDGATAVRLTGSFSAVGGPPPGSTSGLRGYPVAAVKDGRVVARDVTGEHGRFDLVLDPGRYLIRVMPGQGGSCRASENVNVTAHPKALALVCPVP